MRIHYFQRYHEKENVATANTMLLLSRLYRYSSDKFFRFLKSEIFFDSFEPELVFKLQEKSRNSIPDATITQESFKIVVETKLNDWFNIGQLMNHLESFAGEKYKVIISIASELMAEDKMEEFEKKLKQYNDNHKTHIIHINTTFEKLANAIQEILDDRDYEMQEILDDYFDYCYNDHLIVVSDSWKFMRMQLSNSTFDFNISKNIYYDNAERGFRAHDYLSLYKQKSVRAVGKIYARVLAMEIENEIVYEVEDGKLTEDMKNTISDSMEYADERGDDLRNNKHRYFFVDKFYETDFKKSTPYAPRGSRIFDLTEILEIETIPETKKIAELLKEKEWG
jgi:hypothetical protein